MQLGLLNVGKNASAQRNAGEPGAPPKRGIVKAALVDDEAKAVAKALLNGVDEYLFKPVDTAMIRERLEIMGVYTARMS